MKLVVSDFDNTLFTDDYEQNIDKINDFVKKGNMFAIATGRNFEQLKKEIKGKNIKYDYLICNDGAVIFNKKLELIHQTNIELNIVNKIIEILENDCNVTNIFIDDGYSYISPKNNNVNAVIARYTNISKANIIMQRIKNEFPTIDAYLSFRWINIVNKNASKGNAINHLAKKLNINKKNIYTVGDNTNDISMNKMFNGYYMTDLSKPELIEVSKGGTNSVWELINKIEKGEI